MSQPNFTAYVVDDFIYKSTLGQLYNFSRPWISDLGPHDKESANPHNKRRASFIYYRPRVEAQALARPVAFEHMVTLRLRRLPEERAQIIDATLTRAEESIIHQTDPLQDNWKLFIERIYNELIGHNQKEHLLAGWKPSHEDIITRARTYYTNYIALINTFWNQPAAGLAWLTLRHRANAVTDELLTQHFGAWRRKRIPTFDTYTKRPVTH